MSAGFLRIWQHGATLEGSPCMGFANLWTKLSVSRAVI